MITRRFLVASLLVTGALTPTLALAQTSDTDKATARDLTIEGYKSLESRDYAGALDRFTRADGNMINRVAEIDGMQKSATVAERLAALKAQQAA